MSALLAGCSILEDTVARTHDQTRNYEVPTAFTTADARIVTDRPHPINRDLYGYPQKILCVEPAPDAIRAVSASAGGELKGGSGSATGGVTLSGVSAEAAAELSGRSTALLALRDGLYRACEAYANGSIGATAYALILSRYAQSETTLFLAQDITGAAGAEGKALAAADALSKTPLPQAAAPASNADSNKKTSTGATGAAKTSLATPPAANAARVWLAMGTTPGAATPPAPEQTKPAKNAAAQTKQTTQSPTQTPQSNNPAQAAGVSATAALALARMNEDYLALGFALPTALVVACIDEFDPTRSHSAEKAYNSYLVKLCADLDSIEKINAALTNSAKLIAQLKLIDPTSAGSAAPSVGKSH